MAASSSSRHLLVPFAGRSSPALRAALPALRLPHLETLLGRLTLEHDDTKPETTMSPPHERALSRALGLDAYDGLIPWGAWEAQRSGLSRIGSAEPWAVLTLCHWEVAIDEVVLDDPGGISVDGPESEALLEAARPLFHGDGISLRRSAAPGRWLARGEIFRTLATASVDRAAGRPISEWAPLSDALKPIRKLQNEMQMLLYTQRVNDERNARGVQPVNSFWLSGTGALPKVTPVAEVPAPTVVDTLRAPALRDDAPGWTAAWEALDAGPIAALLAEHTGGAQVELTLCGDRAARRFKPQPRGAATLLKNLFRRPQTATVLEAL